MPSETSPDNLASFIRQLDAATLSSVLIELAADHAVVHERLERLQLANQPKALAKVFRKKLAAWKRSTQYVDYSQVDGVNGEPVSAWHLLTGNFAGNVRGFGVAAGAAPPSPPR
jgi:hypothetical protein